MIQGFSKLQLELARIMTIYDCIDPEMILINLGKLITIYHLW